MACAGTAISIKSIAVITWKDVKETVTTDLLAHISMRIRIIMDDAGVAARKRCTGSTSRGAELTVSRPGIYEAITKA